MRRFLSLPVLAVILIALPLASCSEQAPLEPAAPAAALTPGDSAELLLGSLLGTITDLTTSSIDLTKGLVSGVLACPSSETYTDTERIGPWGGRIDVGPHRLYIPPGALDRYVTITATAPAGDVTTVEFEPHGLRFDRPTVLTMSYAHCGLISGLTKRIVYVDRELTILEVLPSVNNLWRREVNGKLDHFSAYAVAE